MEKNRKLTAAVFSPTGGTMKAAQELAQMLSQNPEYLDLTRRKFQKQQHCFGEKDLLLAAAPVYGGQLPRMERELFTNFKGNHTPCILMAGYGNRHYDNTLAQMQKILEDRGFYCIGAIACIIPHIYSDKMGAGRPDCDDLKGFKEFSVLVKKRLEEGNSIHLELPVEPEPEPKEMKPVKKTWDKEACSKCQVCVQKCPTGAINPETMEIDEQICINCMRCAKLCIANARSYDCNGIKSYLEANFLKKKELGIF